MKFIPLLLFILLYSNQLKAQNFPGSIKGIIIDSNGGPIELVNILIEGTRTGDYTDEDGKFEIKNLNPGVYTMKVSSVGYKAKELKVTLKTGENNYGNIILEKSTSLLPEVVVNADKINKYRNPQSEYISKLKIRNLDNPQSYSSTTAEMLKEQNVVEFSSALTTIPGGNISSENPTGITGIFLRGFPTNSFIQNGVYSFSPDGGDPQVIERIELIRGPSGPVYGTWGVGYGGLVNRVTKQPFNSSYYSVGITLGSFNLQRFTGDVNLPLNENKTLLMRVNAALHSQSSFQDYGYRKSTVIAPVFLYKPSENFSMLTGAEISEIDRSASTLFGGAAALRKTSIDKIKTDYFKSYSSVNLTNKPDISSNYYSRIDFSLTDKWKLSTNFAAALFSYNGLSIIPVFLNDSLLFRRIYDYSGDINSFDIQPEVKGEFMLGHFKNQVIAGFDYQWVDVKSAGSIIMSADTLNYLKYLEPVLNVSELRTRYDLSIRSDESRNSYSLYVNNALHLIDNLDVILGLRYDYMDYNGTRNLVAGTYNSDPFNQGTWSPQAGAAYQLIKDQLSVYANYMQGFNYVTSNVLGQSFDPEFANQYEAGIKTSLFNKRFSSTISYYDIRVSNKVRRDPANPMLSVQDGTQLSCGIDLDIRTNPVKGLNFLIGYAYNKSKFEEADSALIGKRPLGVPEHMAVLWVSYTFQDGIFNGVGVGGGLNYSSDFFYDDLNTLTIPSYKLIKGTLSYNYNWFGMNLTVSNLTDERYWDYNGSPQLPRRILFTVMFNI